MTWRTATKSAAERALLASGIVRYARTRVRRRTLVLAYHNIVPHGERPAGDRSLHLPQACFASQLDLLLETHDVVGIDAILAPPAAARPRVVITFDDAYAGAMTAGIEELRVRGLPATVFVAPAFVDGGAFWWDLLADRDAGLAPAVRSHALEQCRGQHERVLAWARAEGCRVPALPEHARCAAVADLDRAAATPGVTVGSHTWSHPNLARLAEEELAAELERPVAWLDVRFPSDARRWFSYPYGRYTDQAERAVRATGYAGAFRIDGGWVDPALDATLRLPRLNVPAGLSTQGLAIRAAGLLCT